MGATWFYASGGGAAGQYLTGTVTEPPAGLAYTVYIGGGSSAQNANYSQGATGGGTYFYRASGGSTLELYAVGGGGGNIQSATSAGAGGGGGGGGRGNSAWDGLVHSNGYYGGDGNVGGAYNGGGGAGTGGDGVDAGNVELVGAAGGAGYAWLDGVTRGGGGGGATAKRSFGVSGNNAGAGGSGGGGNGASVTNNDMVNGSNATVNTGSGGGGGGRTSTSYGIVGMPGNGASGVAIVRYQGGQRGTGGTITSSGGYTYHTFNSSGTFTTA